MREKKMTLRTDRELLKVLELSESFVANLIGKTRQAVSAGLSDDVYFRSNEMAAILNYCRVNKSRLVPVVQEYVERSRPADEVDEILSSHGMFLKSDVIDDAGEIWAVLPDYKYFKATHPSQFETLVERARREISSFTLVTVETRDAERFWEDCSIEKSIADSSTQIVPEADALPYSLILEPAGQRVSGWALVTGGFQRIDEVRTEGMRSFLGKKFDRKKISRQANARPRPAQPSSAKR